jgi:hypothetical protein
VDIWKSGTGEFDSGDGLGSNKLSNDEGDSRKREGDHGLELF